MAWNEVKIKVGDKEFLAFQNTSRGNLFEIPCKMKMEELSEFQLGKTKHKVVKIEDFAQRGEVYLVETNKGAKKNDKSEEGGTDAEVGSEEPQSESDT